MLSHQVVVITEQSIHQKSGSRQACCHREHPVFLAIISFIMPNHISASFSIGVIIHEKTVAS
jgi:hypothetical protein